MAFPTNEFSRAMIARLSKTVRFLEDGLLVTLLTVMIVLAVTQIFLRNVFGVGIEWADPLLRALVLWVAMIGAVIATRTNKHISINIIPRFFPPVVKATTYLVAYLITATVSAIIAWHSYRFAEMEYEYAAPAFNGVPTWVIVLVLPIGFSLIALRYVVLMIKHMHDPFSKKSDL